MIKIEKKENCCGCFACESVCPVQCIKMEYDEEGFRYPKVDESKCIHCNLCNKVCHLETGLVNSNSSQPDCYGAYSQDKEIVRESSSGGIFWELVKKVIAEGGVVFGATLVEGFKVVHKKAETLQECEQFRKSKYLQSDMANTLQEAKKCLKEGRKVLFSGTPCQIAGLYAFLQGGHELLYTVDIVCHGVPSRVAFERFMEHLVQKEHKAPTSICWRDKRNGWGPNHVSIQFADGSEQLTSSQQNLLQNGFLNNFYLRPSCYSCKYAAIPRIADISLADFWGYEGELNENNHNEGLSLVVVSSEKGQDLFESITQEIVYKEVPLSYAMAKSRHLHKTPKRNPLRKGFMRNLLKGRSFEWLGKHYINGIGIKLIKKAERVKRKVGSRLTKLCKR